MSQPQFTLNPAKALPAADLIDAFRQVVTPHIGDNHAYLIGNRDPMDHMIEYLKKFFSPDNVDEG